MNKITCFFCGSSNFVLDYKCIECGNIIREKVPTINLGEILIDLLLNTRLGIKKILYAEHKNYLLTLFLLLSLKLSAFTLFYIEFIDLDYRLQNLNFVIGLVIFWLIYLLIVGLLLRFLFWLLKLTRIKFKTILSLIVFSFIYFSVSIVILLPIEFMIFGKYLFSGNPSIFEIDMGKAVVVIFVELVIIAYSLYLIFNLLVFILHKKLLSFFLTLLCIIIIFLGNEIFQIIIGVN